MRNVTDVDDDILRVARERGIDYRVLGDRETLRFDRDMADLGLLDVDASPRASDRVPEMVEWVVRLIRSGAAYEVDGWVYFDVASFPRYGAFSGLDTETMVRLSRQRGGNPDDPRKRNPLDFVLWQPSLPDEPHWPSPWSAGRPGWHIECTVLAATELTLPIDIHGGGDDLIFPHHESEIAQAVCGRSADVRPPLGARRHGRLPGREDEQVARQPGVRQGPAQPRPCGGDPAAALRPPPPRRVGVRRVRARPRPLAMARLPGRGDERPKFHRHRCPGRVRRLHGLHRRRPRHAGGAGDPRRVARAARRGPPAGRRDHRAAGPGAAPDGAGCSTSSATHRRR